MLTNNQKPKLIYTTLLSVSVLCGTMLLPSAASAYLDTQSPTTNSVQIAYTATTAPTDIDTLKQPTNTERPAYTETQNTPPPSTEHMKEARSKYEADRLNNVIILIGLFALACAVSTISAALVFKLRQKRNSVNNPITSQTSTGTPAPIIPAADVSPRI